MAARGAAASGTAASRRRPSSCAISFVVKIHPPHEDLYLFGAGGAAGGRRSRSRVQPHSARDTFSDLAESDTAVSLVSAEPDSLSPKPERKTSRTVTDPCEVCCQKP